ncbi:uncharacterized protein LOC131230536 [Magnolia sinica]|uniref:uncharacterized protein LOC131230536 n=1 Tax=Magnolia sinica TaxID=86752 RepID=UPI002657C6AF|nr:uncharacterized protein LOC131230536 [Magnolia sinica]
MMLFIHASLPVHSESDSIIWNLEKSSIFSVRSLYNFLINSRSASIKYTPHFCWKYPVPPKLSAFTWLVCKKKILTIDNLRKRGMVLTNICLCCMRDEEYVNHLLLHCPFISEIWPDLLLRFNMSWVFPNSVDLLILAWNGVDCNKYFTHLWRMAILAIWWSVWEERNRRCFTDSSNFAQVVASRAKRSLIEWASIDDKLRDCGLQFLGT